jgi:hypothetical protein
MTIGNATAGMTGHLSRTGLSADVTGRTERYTCAAELAIPAAAAKLNGFVLIVTHAADPYQLTPDTLMDLFASPGTPGRLGTAVTLSSASVRTPYVLRRACEPVNEGMPGTDIGGQRSRVVSPADTWSR